MYQVDVNASFTFCVYIVHYIAAFRRLKVGIAQYHQDIVENAHADSYIESDLQGYIGLLGSVFYEV